MACLTTTVIAYHYALNNRPDQAVPAEALRALDSRMTEWERGQKLVKNIMGKINNLGRNRQRKHAQVYIQYVRQTQLFQKNKKEP